MTRLSFVVPVYKVKPEIFEKHVKALRDQALKDFEVIWVLDGPSQTARAIIAKTMKDSQFAIHEIEHAGANAARNYGGARATGDILCFLDSDSVVEPGTSNLWVDQFDKHPEVGFIYSGYKWLNPSIPPLESEPFDPWTLRIRNYISGNFPMRRDLYPGWTEGLKSLQDWDMWLSLLEKAEGLGWDINKIGKFIPGYAFATAYPEAGSISGENCLPEVWLDRVNAVKTLHHLPKRKICVSSLQYRHDGLALAKLIDADYQDNPTAKPHDYESLVFVGVSPAISKQALVKQVLFWTCDDINEIWNSTSGKKIDATVELLNTCVTQYCEDREAKRLLTRWGFNVEINPMPLGAANIKPMPEARKWVVDNAGDYSPMISVIAQSVPDIQLDVIDGSTKLSDYRGLIHFFPDRTLSASVKRAHLMGRHVISNIQQPYCGFVDDKYDIERFIIESVDKIRELTDAPADPDAPGMYANSTKKLLEVCA